MKLFPGKVTGLIFSSGDEIPADESAWHLPKTVQKHEPTWFGYCKKKIKSIMCMHAKRIRGAYSAMLGLIFLCQASSKKGKMKHLAVMEHAAGPVAFNKIGINSLVQRERKNSEHPKIFNLVIFKLTALKICL